MAFQKTGYGVDGTHRVPFVKLTKVHIQCKDPEGKPYAGREYRIVLPRGKEIRAKLDSDGWAKHEGIYPGEVLFELFPEGEVLVPTPQEAKPEVHRLRLRFEDEDGEPFIGKPFAIQAGSLKLEGTTDGSGKLVADVPVSAQEGEVTIWLDADKSGESYTWPLRFADHAS
ncbi:MAG: hypothetical protein D6731_06550 [Planctomycetota bacterium]|nr:MAG: hypothetical protein D6731_06550 [Planctomycetota bacterium]